MTYYLTISISDLPISGFGFPFRHGQAPGWP